jgi:hypothetical protein
VSIFAVTLPYVITGLDPVICRSIQMAGSSPGHDEWGGLQKLDPGLRRG